jgi:hypothetical protein
VPPNLWAVRITRSRYTSARTVFLGAAVVVLAGCGSAAGTSSAASSSSPAGAASSATGTTGATAIPAVTPTASPGSVVAAGSIPFPVAVGDTWVYQVVTSINHQHALDTKRVVDVTPVPDGHRVTMSDSAGSGSAASTLQHYLFYGNGQIGFPVNEAHGVSVVSSNGVTWPDAAGAASGRSYHSVLNIKLSSGQVKTANVTVRGGGTQSVLVPAGTYRATLVTMTMVSEVGSFITTAVMKVWTAAGTGPVKTQQVVKAGGETHLITTSELVSFTRQAPGS